MAKKYATLFTWDRDEGPKCSVYYAGPEELKRDGDNYVGSNDELEMFCSETLEEAIREANFWAAAITFDPKFTDDEKAEIVRVINKLIHDPDYTRHYAKCDELDEQIRKGVTSEELKFFVWDR